MAENSAGSPFLGCAAFGLNDSVVGQDGMAIRRTDFVPGSVVLPGKSYGSIVVGEQAGRSRVHSGLPWPPEAWIKAGETLRRAPIFCLWRALVEARDRQARWEVGGGVSFPLARILAAHIADLLVRPGEENQIAACLAIPDDLDEYGQESLFDEMKREFDRRKVRGEVRLLWRPVAAGLSWLADAGGDMKSIAVRSNPDDFFLVLYLGPDAFECVPFRLRVRRHRKADNIENDYILLRRERPKGVSSMAGYDWPAGVLEEMLQQKGLDSAGAFWQAWVLFPELWAMLAGRLPDQKDLPRVWGQENGYDFWRPGSEDFEEGIEQAGCRPSKQVQEILKASCEIQGTSPHDRTWLKELNDLVRKTVSAQKNGRMVGMVVCGPLAPSEPPFWLRACFPDLEARGLDTSGPWENREANRLWMSPGNDVIAAGAALFQQRLRNGEPTYLDTLPQYFLLTKADGRYTTSPLVNAEDVDGGKTYTNRIEGFAIEKDRQRLDVVIARGAGHEQLLLTGRGVDLLDQEVGRNAKGLSVGGAGLVRHLVRTAKNRDKALERVRWNTRNIGDPNAALCYGEAYADLWHEQLEGTEERQLSLWQEVKSPTGKVKAETPFRRLTFPFPVSSPQKMLVELQVRIRPASGMAQMEVIPQDTTFLHGRKVFVDYRSMRPCQPDELVSDTRGWPPLEELAPHPDPGIWDDIGELVDDFEKAIPRTERFNRLLKSMYVFLKTPKRYIFPVGGGRIFLPVLSQNGLAGCRKGEELIAHFVESLQRHTTDFQRWENKQVGSLITRATWLYGASPVNVNNRIKEELTRRGVTTRIMEAGSRSLMGTPGLAVLLGCIAKRIQNDGKFVIQSIRATKNVLTLRKSGQDALDEKTADILLKAVLGVIEDYASRAYYKNKFFVSIKLLLYMLRYRKCDERFLSADSERTDEIKEKLKGYRVEMERNMPFNRFINAREIINGTIGYLDYAGKTDFLATLTEYSGADDDNAYAGDDR